MTVSKPLQLWLVYMPTSALVLWLVIGFTFIDAWFWGLLLVGPICITLDITVRFYRLDNSSTIRTTFFNDMKDVGLNICNVSAWTLGLWALGVQLHYAIAFAALLGTTSTLGVLVFRARVLRDYDD